MIRLLKIVITNGRSTTIRTANNFKASDLPDFFDILNNYDNSEEYVTRLDKYGINRAEDNFWDVYDWFQNEFDKYHGKDGGIVDLNRYCYYAAGQM